MLHEEPTKKREQISMVCIDELVPKNHLLRKIDRVMTGHSYFPCSAPPFACGKSCSFLCHLKLTGKPAFLQTGWGTACYLFVFRKEFAVKKEGSPVSVSLPVCVSRLPVFSSRWRLLPVHPVYAVRRNGRSWLVFPMPLKYAIPDRKGQRRLSPGPFRLRLGGGQARGSGSTGRRLPAEPGFGGLEVVFS